MNRIEVAIRRTTVASTILCVLLAVWLVMAWATTWLDLPRGGPDRGDSLSFTQDAATLETYAEQEVSRLILGKAIFRGTRIPETPVVDDTGRYVLLGASLGGGETRAYVKDTKLNTTVTLYEGDQLGGRYRVLAIGTDSVELQRGSETIVLRK